MLAIPYKGPQYFLPHSAERIPNVILSTISISRHSPTDFFKHSIGFISYLFFVFNAVQHPDGLSVF